MLRNAEGEEITLTRAERRRLEKMRGKPVTYQYTLDQIEAIKRQAVADKKEELKKEIAAEIGMRVDGENHVFTPGILSQGPLRKISLDSGRCRK